MANTTLLGSAICSSICHLTAFLISVQLPPSPYIIFIIIALITSIWNHSTTSDFAKWIDRLLMLSGTIITYIIAPIGTVYLIMPIVIGSYGLAKIFKSNKYHIIAHICITIINTYIILYGF